MKRIAIAAAVLCGFAIISASQESAAQEKKDKKAHTIKEIMKIAHTDKMALLKDIASGLKGEPKWDDIAKKSKELVEIAGELASAKPKKGEADSWKKVTGEYTDRAKELDTAADKKDASKAKTALGSLQTSCKGCHSQHK